MLSWIEAGFEPPKRQLKSSQWIGLSGRAYALEQQDIGDFVLNGADLYLIARGNSVLWVGCSLDLVAEPAIRLRFRKAMARADGVFRLPRPHMDDERFSVIADLEGALPARIDQAA